MAPEVRYCTTDDGVRIAYCVEGDGPPLLFSHFVYAFSLSHTVPTFDDAIHRVAAGHTLIRYDVRGTGLSQRSIDDFSPAATVRDLEAVVRDAKLEPFTLLGASIGGPRAIAYAVGNPTRVSGLVLYDTFPRIADPFPAPVLKAIAQLARANWQLATRTMVDQGIRRQDETEGLRWAQMLQDSITGEAMARYMETHADLDVTPLLPRIKCPTLVCHSRIDPIFPFEAGQRVAAQIPGARLIPLEGDRGGPFTDAEPAIEAMRAFLSVPAVPPELPSEGARPVVLTSREIEILRLIAGGSTSSEISGELQLSLRTVGRHITNIYNKIGARGRADATSYALRHHIAQE